MTNDYLENETGSRKYTCTSAQLKKYLDQYGFTLDEALKPVIDEISTWREAVKNGEAA